MCACLQCLPNADEVASLDTYRRSGRPPDELADADRVLFGERVVVVVLDSAKDVCSGMRQ
jgi:hypothetical protein